MHWIHLAQTIALTGATVHPMTPGSAPLESATVLIEDDRILAVGVDVEIPEDAEELDLTGLHLVPGLIDGHANHDVDHDALYLAHGVTLVRDTGNDPVALARSRVRAQRDAAGGPSLLVAGAPVDGRPPATLESLVLSSPEEAAELLPRYMESYAPDFLAMGASLDQATWEAVLQFGAEQGLPVWGPVPRQLTFPVALAGGQRGFIGFEGLVPEGKGWHEVEDLSVVEANVRALEEKSGAVTPLLNVYSRLLVERDGEQADLGLLAPHYRPLWVEEARVWREQVQGEVREVTERSLAMQQSLLARLWRSKVVLVPGGGAPNSWLLPGQSLLDELGLWEDAGIPVYEVLRLATATAAVALGVQADHGAIAEGRLANLVAIGLDPGESLAGLEEPELVVLRGRVYERPELEERVAELRERQEAAWQEVLAPLDVRAPDLGTGVNLLISGRTETRSSGLRVQAEHFAVGRREDGKLVFAARVVTPGAVSGGVSTETLLTQVIDGNLLESFDMVLEAEGRRAEVQGRKLGGLMNVEARVDGAFVYNERARETLNMVDVGSGLSGLLVAKILEPGDSYVLGFRQIQPMVHRWKMGIASEDNQFVIDTGAGFIWYGFQQSGAPQFGVRQQGNGSTELVVLEVLTGGGAGLDLPAERVWTGPDGQGSQEGGQR